MPVPDLPRMSVLASSSSMVLLTASCRQHVKEVSLVSTMVSEFPFWELFPTVVPTSVSSILSLVTTPTRRTPTDSSVLPPSSSVRRCPLFLLDTLRTPSIQFVVVYRCNPRSQRKSGCTRVPWTASKRSCVRRELPLFSRVLVQTLFVRLELLLCWCFTPRSPLHSVRPNKQKETNGKKREERNKKKGKDFEEGVATRRWVHQRTPLL
mmetsp:Transcript_31444/g.72366  ORF Transcript_31444/g.72366 Transcript_31444/m.72366 type:complete len:208 (+) Transcript_31444:423-1046(+)